MDDLIVCLFFVIIFIHLSTFKKSGAKYTFLLSNFAQLFLKVEKIELFFLVYPDCTILVQLAKTTTTNN